MKTIDSDVRYWLLSGQGCVTIFLTCLLAAVVQASDLYETPSNTTENETALTENLSDSTSSRRTPSWAEEDPLLERLNSAELPTSKKSGRYCQPGDVRAGCPTTIGRYAKCAVTDRNSVGYVGGGTFRMLGETRYPHEGIFGLDYSGWNFHRTVFLNWSHGVRYQGGAGAYKTDGPKLLE